MKNVQNGVTKSIPEHQSKRYNAAMTATKFAKVMTGIRKFIRGGQNKSMAMDNTLDADDFLMSVMLDEEDDEYPPLYDVPAYNDLHSLIRTSI